MAIVQDGDKRHTGIIMRRTTDDGENKNVDGVILKHRCRTISFTVLLFF